MRLGLGKKSGEKRKLMMWGIEEVPGEKKKNQKDEKIEEFVLRLFAAALVGVVVYIAMGWW